MSTNSRGAKGQYWLIRANDSVECAFFGNETQAQTLCDARAKRDFTTRWRHANPEATFREYRQKVSWRIAELDVIFAKQERTTRVKWTRNHPEATPRP